MRFTTPTYTALAILACTSLSLCAATPKDELASILTSHGVSAADQQKILNSLQKRLVPGLVDSKVEGIQDASVGGASLPLSRRDQLSDLLADKVSAEEKQKILNNIDFNANIAGQKIARRADPLSEGGERLSQLLGNKVHLTTPFGSTKRQELPDPTKELDQATQLLDNIDIKTPFGKTRRQELPDPTKELDQATQLLDNIDIHTPFGGAKRQELPDPTKQLDQATQLLDNIDIKTPFAGSKRGELDDATRLGDHIAVKTGGMRLPLGGSSQRRRDGHGHGHAHGHGHGHGHGHEHVHPDAGTPPLLTPPTKRQESTDPLTGVLTNVAGTLGLRQESTDPLTGVLTNVAGTLGLRQESTDPLTGLLSNVAGTLGVRQESTDPLTGVLTNVAGTLGARATDDAATDPLSALLAESLHGLNSLGSRDNIGLDKLATANIGGLQNVKLGGQSLPAAPLRRLIAEIAQTDLSGLDKSSIAGMSLPVAQRDQQLPDLSGLAGITLDGEQLSPERQNLLKQAVTKGYGVLKQRKRFVSPDQLSALDESGILVSGKDNGFNQGKGSTAEGFTGKRAVDGKRRL